MRDLVAELRNVPFDYATSEPASSAAVRKVVHNIGYRLVEDAWRENGRRTYQHGDNANAAYMRSLAEVLEALHWHCAGGAGRRLLSFTHITTGEMIEIEPGGAGLSGHYLHHMTAKAAAQ